MGCEGAATKLPANKREREREERDAIIDCE